MRKVYDFDGTIYRGDSEADFCLFALARRPGLLVRLPGVARAFLAYRRGDCDITAAKEALHTAVLRDTRDVDGLVEAFWQGHLRKIKRFYRAQQASDDAVASASPAFLLRPACEKLGIGLLIASPVNPYTGAYQGLNCSAREKARRVRDALGDEPFAFYSDSMNDVPTAILAAEAYLVKGERVRPWPQVGG